MCMTGIAAASNPTSSMMTCPDRRSASTSVPYSNTTRTISAVFDDSAFDIRRTMSSVMCSVSSRIESRDVTTRMVLCFMSSRVSHQTRRINRQRALRGNPRGEHTQRTHRQNDARHDQRIPGSGLVDDECEHLSGEEAEKQTCD